MAQQQQQQQQLQDQQQRLIQQQQQQQQQQLANEQASNTSIGSGNAMMSGHNPNMISVSNTMGANPNTGAMPMSTVTSIGGGANQNIGGVNTTMGGQNPNMGAANTLAGGQPPGQSVIQGQDQLGSNQLQYRNIIWEGQLEWQDKRAIEPGLSPRIARSLGCMVSIANADQNINTANWPQALKMQLMPQTVFTPNQLHSLYKNSRQVAFYFHNTNLDHLKNLYKVMSNGFAGCVHFQPNTACGIRVLLLLYINRRRSFVGLIPNDQSGVVNCIRQVIPQFRHRMQQTSGQNQIGTPAGMQLMDQTNMGMVPQGTGPGPAGAASISIRKLGSNMHYDTDKIIGRGSSSLVYEGSFISEHMHSSRGMRIAVKCIDCIDGTDATDTQRQIQKLYNEVYMMEKVEPHRNVNIVGFYGSHVQVDKLFIGFEFCQGTIRDYVKNELPYTDLRNLFKPIEANRCMVNGLNFLHKCGIVHRDLKPENIFIVHDGMQISKVVLGDFGSAKVTTDSLFSVTGALGTIGYIAPEAWDVISKLESNSEFRQYLNKKTDIFSLGILFYYSVTLGKHPYGNQMTSQLNIVQGKSPDLDCLENKNDPLRQLLEKMLANKEDDRPSSKEVCEHPALWNSKEILDFFVAKSDAFEAMVREDSTKSSILENAFVLPNGNWMLNLPSSLKSYLQQKKINGRKLYEGKESSVRYLLRAIRNITNHFRDFPSDVQSELGSYPDGHADFWMNYCPKLLIRVYEIL